MNYILIIHKEHTKQQYCLGSLGVGICTTCGCNAIRKRIFDLVICELDIAPEGIGVNKNYGRFADVRSARVLKLMIENLCYNLNKLDEEETRRIGKMSEHSFMPEFNHDSILVFIIMEIWNSLTNIYQEHRREEALKYFLDLIDNEVVVSLIKLMDSNFRRHHY